MRLNPDVILDTSMMERAGDDPAAREQHLRELWLTHDELAAVQNGVVFDVLLKRS